MPMISGVGRLFELAQEAVTIAEDISRHDDTRAGERLRAAARTFAGEVTIYGERLKDQGAQVAKVPPPRGES
jgi:hypothetical protein